jgi:hypothetical protein
MATGPVAQNSKDFTDDADVYFGGRISANVNSERRIDLRELSFHPPNSFNWSNTR